MTTISNNSYPSHLKINGRPRLPTKDFLPHHKLYRSFTFDDVDEIGDIKVEHLRFPDLSFNWGNFSKPEDIRFRKNRKSDEGCYSILVSTSRYNNIATPVHDPINEGDYENYAHVEVRELHNGEGVFYEPPKNRKNNNKRRKSLRLAYRQNMANNAIIELSPEE